MSTPRPPPTSIGAALPYQFAAADATPLFLTTMLDYVRASGDLDFLKAHKDKVLAAWQFETTHDADHDGIYDNAQGTGWVESWPPGMPKQEIYLALMDQQGSAAMGQLASLLKDAKLATDAAARAASLRTVIEREYYSADRNEYGFSQNNGTIDRTSTVFPTVAWWNSGVGYDPGLEHSAASLARWSSHDFSTDWGARDLAASDPMYDPISYHQGSVWPLFTGWNAMAQYRSGRSLAGYQSLMQNADLTTAQDLGAVTELLSGDFFEPFGRSTSHQLWSSAMVVTPVLRGLFGVQVDAIAGTVTVAPHLPADWDSAQVNHLHVGASIVNLVYRREGRIHHGATETALRPIGPSAGGHPLSGHTSAQREEPLFTPGSWTIPHSSARPAPRRGNRAVPRPPSPGLPHRPDQDPG